MMVSPWENIRDNVYVRYQVEQKDGYDIASRNMWGIIDPQQLG